MLSSNGLQAAGQGALVVAASVDDEEVNVDILGNLDEEWMLGEGGSESHPRVKEAGTPNSSHNHDAVVGHLHCREEFRAESIVGCKGYMRQGMSYDVLKRVRSCTSERS